MAEIDDGLAPSTESCLRWALASWKEWIADPDRECNGGDMVEWFFGYFVPKAQAALVCEEAVSERYRRALLDILDGAPATEPKEENYDWETDLKLIYRNGCQNAHWHCARIARRALTPTEPEAPELVQAAKLVVARWQGGDLAGAVRELAALVGEEAPEPGPLSLRLDHVGFSVRTFNVLTSLGVKTLADLVKLTPRAILVHPHSGRRTLKEITEELASRDLKLAEGNGNV